MIQRSVGRLVRRGSVLQALVVALAVLSFHTTGAFAATDWIAIQSAMGATGVVMPGDVLRFELARKDVPYSVNGVPTPAVFVGAVTNGFVAFKERSNGRFYVSGSLPAQESELSALQDSLLQHAQIHITAVYSHVSNVSPLLLWVHFEATGSGSELATWIATALGTIHNPQLGVNVIPGTNSVFNPATILPANLLTIFDEGFVEQMDDFFVFYLPRPDESRYTLNRVGAESGLGVGQSFYINIDLNGGTTATINIDFALTAGELPAVQSMLRAGGFTLPSLSTRYIDVNHTLYFLHATGSGDGFAMGNTLYNVIQIIGTGSNHNGAENE
jgi:hypothetical protein